jgi:spermidine/putrescine-binding protein
VCLVIALLAACSSGATTPPAAETPAPAGETPAAAPTGPLVVLEWSGYELPQFWQPFADQYPKVQVDFSFFAEDSEAYAKMQTGFQTDVLHPCNSWWKLYVDYGLVQPIDTSRLKNWSGIIDQLAQAGQFNGQQYFVPWDWGYESIIVRTDKVEVMPDSWADLWDPQYAGHVALWNSGESNHIMTAVALGLDPWNTTPEQNEQIKQKLIDIKPNLITYWSDYTEAVQLIVSGDAWLVASAWPDAYVLASAEGVPVEYITPKEGRLGYVCGFGISANTRNLDLAYAYIDATIAPESMAALSNEYAYGAANADAIPLTDPAFVEIMQLGDLSALDRTIFFQPLTEEQQQMMTNQWAEVQAEQ